MKHAVVALLVLASLLSGGQKKRNVPPPQVEVVQAAAKRVEDRIELDGTIRNRGEIPIEGLVLHFELLSTGMKPVSVKKGPVDPVIDPGGQSVFLFQMRDEPRAVRFRIRAVDRRKEDLPVIAPGPYVIQ